MTLYVWERDGNKITRGEEHGVLKSTPDIPEDIYFCAFGDPTQTYAFSSTAGRVYKDFADSVLPLITEDVFELQQLYEEKSLLEDRIENTEYIQAGIDSGALSEDDYKGILRDRATWKTELEQVLAKIKELEGS